MITRPRAARSLLAVLGGLCLWLSLPTWDIYPLAIIGVAAWGVAAWGVGAREGAWLGLLTGLACFLPTLSWSGIFVGAMPWIVLSVVQALYLALMGAVLGWVQRPLTTSRPTVAALLIPVAWVLQELVRGTVPFGGFPWARLAFSQADSPLLRWAAVGGAPLIGFVVALIAAAIVLAVVHRRVPVVLGTAAVASLLAAPLIPVPTTGESTARVGMVQGNVPRAGLDFNAQRRQVLDNHVTGTQQLAAQQSGLDLVIWPENASDIDPLRNVDAAAEIEAAQAAVGAPLLIGAILEEPAPEVSNASLLYRGDGSPPERYVKQHPVPFAEYVPYRDFFRLFSDKVDLVRADFTHGTQPVAFEVEGPDGSFRAVPTICFEVAYDGLMREATGVADATGQPSLLVVQTNNATFGYTAESEQQYAISRIRAVEHGRTVAHISTVGVSGFISPDGTSTPTTDLFTAAQPSGEVVLRSGLTLSNRLGPWVEWVCGAVLLAAGAYRVRRGRAGRLDVSEPAPSASASAAMSTSTPRTTE